MSGSSISSKSPNTRAWHSVIVLAVDHHHHHHYYPKSPKRSKREQQSILQEAEKEARADFGKLMLSRDLPMNFLGRNVYQNGTEQKYQFTTYLYLNEHGTDYYSWERSKYVLK